MKNLPTLVEQAAAGDASAFSALVRRFQDFAVAYARAILGDREEAEDAAQDAFLAAWKSLRDLKEPVAFPSWLRAIVHTHCHRRTRRTVPRTEPIELHAGLEAKDRTPLEAILETERSNLVWSAVDALPPNQREAVMLFYMGGHDLTATGKFLSVPAKTVKARLHQARAALREALVELVEDTLHNERPSRTPDFEKRVARLLQAAADGDGTSAEALLSQDGALAAAKGPHPYWGGKPHALHVAAEWGRAEVVRALLAHGADPNVDSRDYGGWKPLDAAIHHDHGPAAHGEVIRLLIEAGAVVDIWAAAAMGDAARVREWLASDPALVHARGPNDATPLHFAATVEVARMLVDAGADLGATDVYGETPARVVSGYGSRRKEAALFLTELAGDMDLFRACLLDLPDRVEAFLAAAPELLHAESASGETPLNTACLRGHAEVVQRLLARGAEVNRKAASGTYPLHCAARNGHLEVVRILLDHGADKTALDDLHQATAADWAEFQGHPEVAAFLRG